MHEVSISQLQPRLRGEIIQPGDPTYESARKVYNGMIDKRPQVIVRCADVADVVHCVNFARDNGILAAVRGGGHNGGGLGICDGGLVIELSRMRGRRVDPAGRTVRVEGGCTWGDVDHATHAFGMATPAGIISTTGVGGLTLGGGIGHLTRKFGLTIDNLLSVDVVLANGSLATADTRRNPDLFWAVRGGGGNFGVVTSFTFRLHPVSTVQAGPTFWPLEQAGEVMRVYREFIVQAPPEVNGFFAFLTVPPAPMFPAHLHMKKVCGVFWCSTASAARFKKLSRPLRQVGEPLLDQVGPLPHPAVQSIFDALYPTGLQWYWRADFVQELSDDAISLHVEHGARLPSMHSTMHLYPIDAAVHRVGKTDTAFYHRDAKWAEVIVGVDPDPANKNHITTWTKRYWEALHPHCSPAAYVNFMMDEGQDRIRASYGDNYPRLAAIKKRYDPDNFFRVNQNILPAAA